MSLSHIQPHILRLPCHLTCDAERHGVLFDFFTYCHGGELTARLQKHVPDLADEDNAVPSRTPEEEALLKARAAEVPEWCPSSHCSHDCASSYTCCLGRRVEPNVCLHCTHALTL
eukprot:m.103240 g.103240  ORF g.103240 m.103240 type:complete len:115 (+) comp10473_c0_seq3:110-454(+)